MNFEDIEIRPREIILSIVIIAIMVIFGLMISGKITESRNDQNEKYYKASKITDSELFQYGMDTSIGNAFIYGDLIAVDPVTYPEIGGTYASVKKDREEYRMHTRTVTHTGANGKTYTTTETYWTWDYVSSESVQATKITFCNVEFDSTKIELPSSNYIDTIKESIGVRYVYYGVPTQAKGTVYAYLSKGGLGDDIVKFYQDMTIDETIDSLDMGCLFNVLFWILWVILTGGLVIGFYYFENKWLY